MTLVAQKLREVPLTDVKLKGEFWGPKIETNRTVTIPHDFHECEKTGRMASFDRVARGEHEDKPKGFPFNDSDVYKTLEAAAYSLATHPDPDLDKYCDGVIVKIAAAQQPDGYLDTYYSLHFPEKRFTNLKDHHELYCAGHLIEAAVAHYRATEKKNFLNVATKLADLLDQTFGPDKRHDVDGHEEIELALIKLSDATGEIKYQKLAEFFVHERGQAANRKPYGPYYQDVKPVEQFDEVIGHAVRQMYLACAMTDLASRGDSNLPPALDRMWTDMTQRKMYITGGVGAKHQGEAFGKPYELPNESAYAETCAAIGAGLWNHRMNLLTGDAKYADVVETITYNGMLAGVSLSGDKFFYVNPLASKGKHHRQAWYDCACCPPNVARFIASLPGRAYASKYDRASRTHNVYVNLYAAGTASIDLIGRDGGAVKIEQSTQYPWNGNVLLAIEPKAQQFALKLRIPGWCDPSAVALSRNGQGVEVKVEKGYATLAGPWMPKEVIELHFPMEPRRVHADPRVSDDAGKVAVARGPVVYCAESADNNGDPFAGEWKIAADHELRPEWKADLLGGVMMIQTPTLALVPYYAWDNREAGEMAVWLDEK
jgi:DUF1680 family protein